MKPNCLPSEDRDPLLLLLEDELAADGFEDLPPHLWDKALGAPAREFLSRPGKHFRARLVSSAWQLCGGAISSMPDELPLIVELMHAGSLIVDDIEDGSQQRRGRPALHLMYGTPLALNTGSWMYFWPLELIDRLPIDEARRSSLLRIAKTTLSRCHRGQALDIALSVTELSQSEIPQVVRTTTNLKTATLMEFAALLGAVPAGASGEAIMVVRDFAATLGTGLQMLDDMGSIRASARAYKGIEDLTQAKATWPWLWAAELASPSAFGRCQELARRVADGTESPARLATALCCVIGDAGYRQIHEVLSRATEQLEQYFGCSEALSSIRSDVDELEKSYG